MGVVAKYKFNQNVYENFIPVFNSTFTSYTITDEIDADGFTIRTIESDSLPVTMIFGSFDSSGSGDYTKQYSLLEILEINTSNVTSMSQMFHRCKDLTYINTNFNTSKVINMSAMFSYCSSLTSLNVSNFNTNQVTNMNGMFYGCSSLTSLDLSNFDTNSVTNMSAMFRKCTSLTSLDLSNFNTNSVTNMNGMFQECSSLTSLDISSFNTSKVANMEYMFNNCSSLTSLDVSNFNTSKVTIMNGMFQYCSSLTLLDVSSFDTSQVTNLSNIFYDCSSLTSLDVSHFDVSKVTSLYQTFFQCRNLKEIDISKWNVINVTNIARLFQNCSSLTSLDLSKLNFKKITSLEGLFINCTSLEYVNMSSSIGEVDNIENMFRTCQKLKTIDISNLIIKQTTNITENFVNCNEIKDIGMIYCNSDTINKISDLITTNTTIWYSDAKLEDLTKKSNITYKEYKMNILECDEEINLRRIYDDIYDELNLETGELTQRIGEIMLDGSDDELWDYVTTTVESGGGGLSYYRLQLQDMTKVISQVEISKKFINDKLKIVTYNTLYQSTSLDEILMTTVFSSSLNKQCLFLYYENNKDVSILKEFLKQNPITVQYELAEPVIKTINLEGKPSINWQGDTYLHLENNTLYPQLDCEVESINYYEIPKLKANTLYTLRYVGEPTQCIFGGLTYKAENNMILTSGSSDNLLYFDKEVRKVVLIEGDVRDRNFDYFEGIESLGAVEIVTHKTNMPIFARGGRK